MLTSVSMAIIKAMPEWLYFLRYVLASSSPSMWSTQCRRMVSSIATHISGASLKRAHLVPRSVMSIGTMLTTAGAVSPTPGVGCSLTCSTAEAGRSAALNGFSRVPLRSVPALYACAWGTDWNEILSVLMEMTIPYSTYGFAPWHSNMSCSLLD